MSENSRQFEDAYEALNQGIAATGTPRKAIAAAIYPGRKLTTAEGLFSRAMTPENTDAHLNIEMIETILDLTRADDFIFYLCDKYGFERPPRKKAALETDIRTGIQGMQKQLLELMKKVEKLEKKNGEQGQ